MHNKARCPHLVNGVDVNSGWVLTTAGLSFNGAGQGSGCDQYGCTATVYRGASIFGVTLAHQVVSNFSCAVSPPTGAPAPILTVGNCNSICKNSVRASRNRQIQCRHGGRKEWSCKPKNHDLLTAIGASGQPYNSGQVSAATGDAAGLAAQNTALMAKLADAINRLSAASGSQTQLGVDNTAVTQAINDLAKQVNQVVNGGNGTGTPPVNPAPPVTSGGSGSGAASSVQGAAVDCVATPTAYGCTPATPPVDCTADPNNLACKKSECEKIQTSPCVPNSARLPMMCHWEQKP